MTASPSRVLMSLVAATLLAVPAAAQFTPLEKKAAKEDPKFFTIDESSIKIEKLGPVVKPKQMPKPPVAPPTKDGVDIKTIINIAEKIWAIIEKNKPVANVSNSYATAVPKGIDHWAQLDSWKPPKGATYRLVAKNGYGMTMIDIKYQVLWNYGGKYKGKGQYLTGVTVEPLRVDVGWGYKLDLKAEVPDSTVVNVGTGEDPLAAMMATLTWKISTVMQDSTGKSLYYIQGNGLMKELGGPFDNGMKSKLAGIIERASKVEFAQ